MNYVCFIKLLVKEMVSVKSSSGRSVSIEMLGVGEVIRRLNKEKKRIEGASDLGVIKAGGFVEEKLKESIAGLDKETRSVDTGRFANSIEFKKTKKAEGMVYPKKEFYPGTSTTTQDVAIALEYGTSKTKPRNHFRNTKARNINKVKEVIAKQIKIGI